MNPTYDFTGQRAPQGCELGHGLATARASAGHVDHGGYVASKHAVGLTRVAGAESAPHGVCRVVPAPGSAPDRRRGGIESVPHLMFWLMWNRLCGSYLRLTWASRA
jgi:NAD(P)-dependent dehydrogenase (short-subunit alcohol dehydrogenase family)